MTLAVYLAQWLESFCKPFRAPSTAACYRRAFASLPPSLVALELHELTGLSIQTAINRQATQHPRAAQLTFDALHVALDRAILLGLLASHPMRGCIRPKHSAKVAQTLSPQQLSLYLQAAQKSPSYPLLYILVIFGLRRGEVLALSWDCIDTAANTLFIRCQRMRINGHYDFCDLKSASSKRALPIPPPVMAELQRIRASQRVRNIRSLIVDTTPETLARHHAAVLAAAGLPHVSLHGLRHSMATAAVADGCPVKVLQAVLGHSTYKLTADLYAHHISTSISAPFVASYATSIMPL